MSKKEFKNLNEQVEILKSKGLIITDAVYTKEILLKENYFFISGYRHPFLKSDNFHYKDGTTFEELYSLFLFDRSLRNILFKNILIIENNIKSIMAYQLSKKYGYRDKEYLKPKNLDTDPLKKNQVKDLISKISRQLRINGKQHSATNHYINQYGYIPLWVLVKVLSFGIISELYSVLKLEDRMEVAKIYNLSPDDLMIFLPLLANYRNICAHEDIIYENKTKREIPETIFHEYLKIKKVNGEYVSGTNDLFSLIIILNCLLRKEECINLVIELKEQLDNLERNLHNISITDIMKRMGFPENWQEIKNIERKKNDEEKQ